MSKRTQAPDGSFVGGGEWTIAQDGTYVGVDQDQCCKTDLVTLLSG